MSKKRKAVRGFVTSPIKVEILHHEKPIDGSYARVDDFETIVERKIEGGYLNIKFTPTDNWHRSEERI